MICGDEGCELKIITLYWYLLYRVMVPLASHIPYSRIKEILAPSPQGSRNIVNYFHNAPVQVRHKNLCTADPDSAPPPLQGGRSILPSFGNAPPVLIKSMLRCYLADQEHTFPFRLIRFWDLF